MTKQLTLKVKREVYERAMEQAGKSSNIPVCEGKECYRFVGLQYHHLQLKGMGGSKRHYTAENVRLLCPKCHAEIHGMIVK